MRKYFILLLVLLFLVGCGVVNPYRSDFKCPPLDDGKCISVGEAYDEALGFRRDLAPSRDCHQKPAKEPPSPSKSMNSPVVSS